MELGNKLAVVVVAYKNRDDLVACYTSLCAIPRIDTIIVVDNSYAEVGSCFDYAGISHIQENVIHARPGGNIGYAGGNNFGIALARARGFDLVLVSNPDVLLDADAVDRLLSEMLRRSLDLISPRLLEKSAEVAESVLSNPGWDLWLGKGVIDIPPSLIGSRYISTFFGACFVATTQIIDSVGSLSDDFFLYGEEIDYTIRMNRANVRWGVSDDIVVSHDRGSSISPGGSSKSLVAFHHAARSTIIVGRKHWPKAVAPWLMARVFMAGWLLLRGRHRESKAILAGLSEGLRGSLTY